MSKPFTEVETKPEERSERLAWVDAARGICVVLVVLMHVRLFVYTPLTPATNGILVWTQLTEFFGAFRLPLLFVLSGLLASPRVRAGWSDERTVVRAVSLYWLYAVWLGVYAVLSFVLVDPGLPFRVMTPLAFVQQLLVPDSMLWFIFALAVYVAVLSSVRRLPPAVVVLTFGAMAVASGALPFDRADELWAHMVYYGVFFAFGVYGAQAVRTLAAGRGRWRIPAALVVFVGCELLWQLTDEGTVLESAVRFVRDTSAVGLAVVVISLASRWRPVRIFASAIGRRTLPIFVLQLPLIWALYLTPAVADSLALAPVRYLAPLLITALIVAASIGIHSVLMATRARVLFALPDAWRVRIVSALRRPVWRRRSAGAKLGACPSTPHPISTVSLRSARVRRDRRGADYGVESVPQTEPRGRLGDGGGGACLGSHR